MSDSTNTGGTYEYKILTAKPQSGTNSFHESEPELNRLISDGWELESTHLGTSGWQVFGTGFFWHMMTFVLRRAVA